jgi:hypothetical protein
MEMVKGRQRRCVFVGKVGGESAAYGGKGARDDSEGEDTRSSCHHSPETQFGIDSRERLEGHLPTFV